ncbi:MAG: hypothetical protein R2828_04575 [Saprospiraceae bacterium]
MKQIHITQKYICLSPFFVQNLQLNFSFSPINLLSYPMNREHPEKPIPQDIVIAFVIFLACILFSIFYQVKTTGGIVGLY